MSRGRHKVFLGMAAGVGKTYRMLQEGHAELEAGRDVVIGYLEPHGRVETEQLADGLPQVARRRLTHKGLHAGGDGPAGAPRARAGAGADRRARAHQRRRAPSTASATRTSPTCSTRGIDVYSTVNVQHLESLNDQVAELTGVRVRETFPDSVLSGADEVVLVDVTPPALIERLRAGKVYKPERVEAALNGFFRVENLEALREVALRQVAEDVEAQAARRGAAARPRRAPRDGPDGAAGGRRATARARHAAGLLAARRAARVALGAAARGGPGHPDRAGAGPRAGRRRGASSSRRCGGSGRCSARRC